MPSTHKLMNCVMELITIVMARPMKTQPSMLWHGTTMRMVMDLELTKHFLLGLVHNQKAIPISIRTAMTPILKFSRGLWNTAMTQMMIAMGRSMKVRTMQHP